MKVAIVGLGYVGLPLAVALARRHDVVGFDVSSKRVEALRNGIDSTDEVSSETLRETPFTITDEPSALRDCEVFIVTVPTPIDAANRPDFDALLKACALVGPALTQGSIVVFESTVYPGVTEEICGPALEAASGLTAGADFKLGYSPERINPGDKAHPLEKITKVVAGGDPATLETLAELYGSVIEAGVHRAPSIKVAEAAKVIENTQRDLNIALMNEVAKICHLLGIATRDVLDAAGTKWNFLGFHPGLVGGHCIGVDPFYLTAKAEELGYRPEVILSGRRINDGMGAYLAQRVVKLIAASGRPIRGAKVGILGFTFKENVSDIRNTKVIDIYRELAEFGIDPLIHDPMADEAAVRREYGIGLSPVEELNGLDALIFAVNHERYAALLGRISDMVDTGGIIVDVRSKIDPSTLRPDVIYWSL